LRVIAEAEGIAIPDEALTLIAREATGSLRDAINLLDQAWATYGDDVTLENTVNALGLSVDKRAAQLARAALTKDLQEGLGIIAAVQEDAVDLARFTRQVVQHLRHALLQQADAIEGAALSEPEREALAGLVKGVEPDATVAALRAFASADMRSDPFTSLPLELALAQLVYAPPAAIAAAPAPEQGVGNARRGGSGQRGRGAPSGSRRPSGQRRPPPARSEAATGATSSSTSQAPASASIPAKAAAPPRELSSEEQMLDRIQAELRSRGEHKLAAYLKGSCVLTIDGDAITLAFFPFAVDFHKSKVEEQLEVVTAAVSKVRERGSTVRCSAADEASDAKSALVAEAERLGAKVVGRREG
jgi:DNA polymerase-3 subunit gamma/tau